MRIDLIRGRSALQVCGTWWCSPPAHTTQLKTARSFNYMFMYTPAPLVSWAQDYSSHVNLETLVSYVDICGDHSRERRLLDENLNRQLCFRRLDPKGARGGPGWVRGGSGGARGVVPAPTGPVNLLARSSLHCKGLEHDALSSS
jgi:hypothetical protein